MPRRLLTLLSAISMLLFLATMVLWVRSYCVRDFVQYSRHTFQGLTYVDEVYQYQSSYGGLSFCWGYRELVQPNAAEAENLRRRTTFALDNRFHLLWTLIPFRQYAGRDRTREHLFLGFGYRSSDTRSPGTPYPVQVFWQLVLPWPFLCLLFAVLPAFRLRYILHARRRLHRLTHNLCPTCDYDLRATPDQCPECGSPTPAKYE
ncbi:MAG: hypothetical protein NTU53_22480 [Planctomycetota bacterium]|nr:hypothetical protein [Planctomycetota bacterium]